MIRSMRLDILCCGRFGILYDAFGKMDASMTAVAGNGPDSIDYAAKVSCCLISYSKLVA